MYYKRLKTVVQKHSFAVNKKKLTIEQRRRRKGQTKKFANKRQQGKKIVCCFHKVCGMSQEYTNVTIN